MSVIEWDESLRVGVPEMDEERKTLVNMLNKIYEILKDGDREQARNYFVNEFITYLNSHLANEEKFLESIKYPDLERHKQAHDVLRREIDRLNRDFDLTNPKDFAYALSLCWGWIYSHIQKVDKKYGEFFNSKHEG
ncbi:MAG: hemerythrin family protein [Aquificae bacterium]|nr:hemerythrin family protein [Aquificota bacterium]